MVVGVGGGVGWGGGVEACIISPASFLFFFFNFHQRIYEAYAGDKNIVLVDGDHNSPRPRLERKS